MPSRKRAKGQQRKAAAASASVAPEEDLESLLDSIMPPPLDDHAYWYREGQKGEKERRKTLQSMLSNLSLDGDKSEDGEIKSEFVFNSALKKLKLSDAAATIPPQKEDCPLCMYALPPNIDTSKYMACCGQVICRACDVRNNPMVGGQMEGIFSLMNFSKGRFDENYAKIECAFCRSKDIFPVYEVAVVKQKERLETRANKGESRALVELGTLYLNGDPVSQTINSDKKSVRDASKAFECFKEAASLNNCDAYYELAMLHKLKYEPANYLACLEKAAELGSMKAHVTLADIAAEKGDMKVSILHHKVLAAVGYSKDSIDQLTSGFRAGHITKDELALSLRAYQAAREEYTSNERARLERIASRRGPDGSFIPARMYM